MGRKAANAGSAKPAKFTQPLDAVTIVSPSVDAHNNYGDVIGMFFACALVEVAGRFPPEIRAIKADGKWYTAEENKGICQDLERQFVTGKIFPV